MRRLPCQVARAVVPPHEKLEGTVVGDDVQIAVRVDVGGDQGNEVMTRVETRWGKAGRKFVRDKDDG